MTRILAVPRRAYALMRWFVILEVGIWRSLFLWVTRRVAGRGPGVEAFSYAKDLAPLLGAFIFVSLIELPVVHVLLPWETVRLVAVVLGVWGLLWMVGFLASMKVFPRLLDDDGLRVRNGTSVDIRVPWDAVASVTGRRRSVEAGRAFTSSARRTPRSSASPCSSRPGSTSRYDGGRRSSCPAAPRRSPRFASTWTTRARSSAGRASAWRHACPSSRRPASAEQGGRTGRPSMTQRA
jgi:hypothetical protein